MEKTRLCAGCLNAEAEKCCRRCRECYCNECILLHYKEKHMRKHLRKLKALSNISYSGRPK